MGTWHWGDSEEGTTGTWQGPELPKLHWAHKPPGISGRQMVVWLGQYEAAFSKKLLVLLGLPQPEAHNLREKVRDLRLWITQERLGVTEAVYSWASYLMLLIWRLHCVVATVPVTQVLSGGLNWVVSVRGVRVASAMSQKHLVSVTSWTWFWCLSY